MSQRAAFLDEGVGEVRAVVTLDGKPERLLLRRASDDPRTQLGAQSAARVASVEPALSSAFLDLGDGVQAMLPFRPEDRPVRGAMLCVEVRAEARRGKVAVVRALGEADGRPRLLAPPPDAVRWLAQHARDAAIITGRSAADMADQGESEALEQVFSLPGGGSIAIEPTRALTAVDVDLGERKGADSKRIARAANLAAINEAARLLRLKGLGGLVVLDLVGRGHDGPAMLAAARACFGPDNPGVAIGPVGKFGTMDMSLPRRIRPIVEILCDADGALSEETLAHRLTRALAREGAAHPGSQLEGRCSAASASRAGPLLDRLRAKMGSRFTVSVVDGPREFLEVAVR